MNMRLGCGAAIVSLAVAASAHANILINGGLESPLNPKMPDDLIYMSPTKNTGALPGWKIVSGTVDVVPNSYWVASEGSDSVDLIGTPGIGEISQSFATTPGTPYTLTFDFSINPQAGPINEAGDTKQLEILALNGKSVLASQVYQGTAGTRTTEDMQYMSESFSFIAAGNETTLALEALAPLNMPAGLTAAKAYCGPVVDNLDLEEGVSHPTPEPASLALLGLGGLLLLRRRRRDA